MTTRECKEGFKEEGGGGETTVKVKLWALIVFLVASISGLMGILYARDNTQQAIINQHSVSITRLEVMLPAIQDNLTVIREELKAIRTQGRH